MIVEMFGYTLEVNFYKSGYSKFYAKKLLKRYWSNPSAMGSHKIGLIKLLRIEQNKNIGLKEAKEAIEKMFDFESDWPYMPRVK